jgi:GTP cyclohydrolase I
MNANDRALVLKEAGVTEAQWKTAVSHVGQAFKALRIAEKTPQNKLEHLEDTPRRIVDVWLEFTKNLGHVPEANTTFQSNCDNLVTCANIRFSSLCSHHFFPFMGTCHVSYLPDKKIIGVSKLPRIVKFFAKTPQVQENLTDDLADYLFNLIKPKFILVMMIAKHTCCASRGVESDSSMVTSARRSAPDLGEIDAITREAYEAVKAQAGQN